MALAACLLQGCAQPVVKLIRIEPGNTLSTAPPKGGYLAMMRSYGVSGDWQARIADVTFQLKRIEDGKLYYLPDPPAWQEDSAAARDGFPPDTRVVSGLLLVELPPGEYEFSRFFARGTAPMRTLFSASERQTGITVYSPVEPLTSRFRVETGRTVYVGEARLFLTYQEYSISFVDRQQRDFPLLAQRYPQVDPSRLDVRLPLRILPTPPSAANTAPMEYTSH